jgi:hypothetical protein
MLTLQRARGKLWPTEYLYYQLWDPRLSMQQKRAFVEEHAHHRMHVACNERHWYQAAADKLLFHTIMSGAGLPTPEVLAITQPDRILRGARSLDGPEQIAAFLRLCAARKGGSQVQPECHQR